MKHLFFDTATERGIVGLAEEGGLIESVLLPFGLQSSKHLIPEIVRLLKKHHLVFSDCGLISCGVGPGSYTGIRVGVALAQSLAFALKKPLIGFSSLSAFKPSVEGGFAAILDAKYAGIYSQRGVLKGGEVHMEASPEVISLDHVYEALREIKIIVTPNLTPLKAKIDSILPQVIWEESAPSGVCIANEIHKRYLNGDISKEGHLDLLYLRKTQVEISQDISNSSSL